MQSQKLNQKLNEFKKNPTCSRSVTLGGKKVDLLDTPLIPFGSKVYASIPTKNQTASFGSADGVKGGIILYSLKTKKRFVRRTLKVMGPGDSAVYKSDFTSIEIEEEEDEVPDVFDSSEEPELDRTYIELNRNSKEVTSKTKRYQRRIRY